MLRRFSLVVRMIIKMMARCIRLYSAHFGRLLWWSFSGAGESNLAGLSMLFSLYLGVSDPQWIWEHKVGNHTILPLNFFSLYLKHENTNVLQTYVCGTVHAKEAVCVCVCTSCKDERKAYVCMCWLLCQRLNVCESVFVPGGAGKYS